MQSGKDEPLFVACRPYDLTLTSIFGPGERKFKGTKVPESESSTERKFKETKVPGSESTREREFHLWYFRSSERKYTWRRKVPVTCANKVEIVAK